MLPNVTQKKTNGNPNYMYRRGFRHLMDNAEHYDRAIGHGIRVYKHLKKHGEKYATAGYLRQKSAIGRFY